MRLALLSVIIAGLVSGFPPATMAAADWSRLNLPSAATTSWTSLLVHPLDSSRLLVASEESIFEQTSEGKWKDAWRVSRAGERILKLAASRDLPHTVFIVTTKRLVRFDWDRGEQREVYQARSGEDGRAFDIAVYPDDPEHWVLATGQGLFESDDAGRYWEQSLVLYDAPVYTVGFTENFLLLSTEDRLFRSEDLWRFQVAHTFRTADEIEGIESGENGFEEDAELSESFLSKGSSYHLAVDPGRKDSVWLAVPGNLFHSLDGGKTWSSFSRAGLPSGLSHRLVFSENPARLFVATDRGIFEWVTARSRWSEVSRGLEQSHVIDLIFQSRNPPTLAVLNSTGIYRWIIVDTAPAGEVPGIVPSMERIRLFNRFIQEEPTAYEVQRAMLRYNSLGPGKIKRWHAASRLKAFIPAFKFGRTFQRTANVDLDRGGTGDPDFYITGPDNSRSDWSADLVWNLNEFLWSSAQTSIDVRHRLLVDQRKNIVEDVARVYFERRRLQTELIYHPPASEREYLDRLTRMQEMTLILDGMTGGMMTKKLEKIYREHPELNHLWIYPPSIHDPA